jgi:uncharacterized protein (DUF2132 family)
VSLEQPNNPLHGVTLKAIVEELVERHGWPELAARIDIRCFSHQPGVRSSLKFLRKTEWARAQVEALYLQDRARILRNSKRNKRRAAMREHRARMEGAEEPSQSLDPRDQDDASSE